MTVRKGPGRVSEVALMEEFNSSKESSSIFGASYYPESEVLRVRFKKGKEIGWTYDYPNFPASKWESFKKAESKGQFFAAHIREQYKSRQVA